MSQVCTTAENDRRSPGAAGRGAERTCAGCRSVDAREALLRLAYVPGDELVLIPDVASKLGGRGVWVHPQWRCFKAVARGGAARSLRERVQVDAGRLAGLARLQLERRIEGLLLAALRTRRLTVGTDAVFQALAACTPALLLVAKDAAGRRTELVARSEREGVPWLELFEKHALGRLLGRDALGFLAVTDRQIAREIQDAAQRLAGLSEDG